MVQEIDTTVPDWTSIYMEKANHENQMMLRGNVSPLELAQYISAVSNKDGGYILLGAYSEPGYGAGYEDTDPELVNEALKLVTGHNVKYQEYSPRHQRIFLFTIEKSDSIALANGSAYIMKNGIPTLISEREVLEKLGLGLDSSLINMLSDQITEQSDTVSALRKEVAEKGKLKNQISGLLVGAFIGWIFSTVLNAVFGLGA
ncbi:hypothetical protein [Salinivibrio costicola]|uniref:Schlafen AlbA-2 domain-containing protein n=1 Tax=Salinivibrio costicola TaxID=51367 RepID=A0ABX6K2T0_SALCS|nr:hypothetical protein [Salinivibrio costicola]QIR05862.1 hypothetical protein HBA18_05445 [Salinivibrio costicola]